MNPKIRQLVADANSANEKYHLALTALDLARKTCRHVWGEVKYTPEIQEGFHIPEETTGGVDRRLAYDVPRKELPKWTRTCRECGRVETTVMTQKKVVEEPKFP